MGISRRIRPGRATPAFVRLAVTLAAVPLFGVAAIWINRTAADRPFSLGFALHETLVSSLGVGTGHLEAPFGGWFPLTVLILVATGIAWTLSAAVAPWRYELAQARSEWDLARALVGTWGADTLSPFALRADKSYFFAANEDAFLAYRVVGGVAIVSGDPIGEPDALEPLFARFLVFARGRGWRVAVLGASEDALPLYRRLQLRAIYHGDEAVLDVAAFSLEGRSTARCASPCSGSSARATPCRSRGRRTCRRRRDWSWSGSRRRGGAETHRRDS